MGLSKQGEQQELESDPLPSGLPRHHLLLISAAVYSVSESLQVKSVKRAVQVDSSWAKQGRMQHHAKSYHR
ncbi:MAG: hypothetical protein HQL72_06975 [Magnetococcales bacterium]|nr:hypothetical protein [Magnetococcales bacterium]